MRTVLLLLCLTTLALSSHASHKHARRSAYATTALLDHDGKKTSLLAQAAGHRLLVIGPAPLFRTRSCHAGIGLYASPSRNR